MYRAIFLKIYTSDNSEKFYCSHQSPIQIDRSIEIQND